MTDRLVCVFSGGLDSTTLVYDCISEGYVPDLVSFDYGQRHRKELQYAGYTAEKLGLRHDVVDLSVLTKLLAESGSSLVTHGVEVPEGHYAEDNMKATVVPNRNMIMLSIAAGIAVARKACGVATGVHAGDHFIYPDCRPQFVEAVNTAVVFGNEGFDSFDRAEWEGDEWKSAIKAPYMHRSKADIAYRAMQLNVPLEDTWSCYKGGDTHCGKCGTCVERLEAINEAGERWASKKGAVYVDYTVYQDKDFWIETVTRGPVAG